jgi:cytidylate kinase
MTDSATLQRCLTFVETQVGPASARPRHPALRLTVTISRHSGAGGIAIAERLAERLQALRPASPAPWTVFHRSLVEKVLAEHNLPAEFARYIPEDRVSYIQDTLEELLGLHPSSSSLFAQVTETILGLAELGNCILVGRGANFILARCPTALHVRLVSALPKRIERIMASQKISETEAADFVRQEDAARTRYLKTHFDARLDDPLDYHLTINTDAFGAEQSAELIAQALLLRFPVSR